jgi:hypothetical protein
MQRTFSLSQCLAQPVQVTQVIVFGEKTGFAVVAALHDVQRDTIQMDARAAEHTGMLPPSF